jgi:hypothetical protein
MKGRRFDTIPEIEAARKERSRGLMKDVFQSCFGSWQDRWNKCTRTKWEYFEGD